MKIVITESQYSGLINDLLSKNLISEQKITKNQVLDVGREQREGGYEYVIVGGTPKVTPDVGYTFNGVKITTVKVSFYGMEIWAEWSKKAMIREKPGTMVFYAQCGDYSKTTLNSSPNPAKLSQSGGANWAKGNFTTFQKGGLVDRTIRQYCKNIKKPSSEYSGIDLDLKGLFLKNYSYMLSSETYDEKSARQEKEYQAHVKQQAAQKAAEADKGYFEQLSDAVSKTVSKDYDSWVAQGGFAGTMNNISSTLEADLTRVKNSLVENFNSVMESLRDYLGGITGGIINTVLEVTGFGKLAVSTQWGILCLYDVAKGNWIKFIFSALGLLTSGLVASKIYGPLKALWSQKVSSLSEGLKKIMGVPVIKKIISPVINTIKNAVSLISSSLSGVSNWFAKTFNVSWVSKNVQPTITVLNNFVKDLISFFTGSVDDVVLQQTSKKVIDQAVVNPAKSALISKAAETTGTEKELSTIKNIKDVSSIKDPAKVVMTATKLTTGGG